ncbi:MAG: hypothetical protein CL483_09785 [Acidobacteria bacterium]|nr:hypothetical protein [Acidobacteriota bacterium]
MGGVATVLLISALPLGAQRQRPLTPLPPNGLRVAPFFDGWYRNDDGTVTLSFGYSNLNLNEVVEIPHGAANFIEPAEFDGGQPTSFPPAGHGSDRPRRRRGRERGVFTVTIPPGFSGEVVWTLVNQEQTFSVPGSAQTGAYQLRWPMAMGSQPPLLSFSADGPTGRGPSGVEGEPMTASVGTPLPLSVWLNDDSVRDEELLPVRRRSNATAMRLSWFKHTGPGDVIFSEYSVSLEDTQGMGTTEATFDQPGQYVLRVRGDNFGRVDSSSGNQCCWTNGYLKVTVTP